MPRTYQTNQLGTIEPIHSPIVAGITDISPTVELYYIDGLAGLPGFARDSCSIIMSICAFHFYIIYFHFFSADHGIPQTFDYIFNT